MGADRLLAQQDQMPPRTRQLADEVARLAGRLLKACNALPPASLGSIEAVADMYTIQAALREALAAYLRTK